MTATDEALLARLNGECEPLGRSLSMVDTKDLRAFIADYRLKCELLRRASPPPSHDETIKALVEALMSARAAFNNLACNAPVSNLEAMGRACRMERDMIDAALALVRKGAP